MADTRTSYAQDSEDILALEHFEPGFKGRFLELGAYDGIGSSPTYLLAEQGWSGVHVEPNWRVTAQWLGRMSGFQGRVQLVHGAIGTGHGLVEYWDSAGPWSTCNPAMQALGRERFGAYKMYVPTFTPSDLVDAFPGAFDVVSIDIDGWCIDIMRAFPWLKVGCRFAVIEALREKDMGVNEVPIVIDYMQSLGFRHRSTGLENVVMVR